MSSVRKEPLASEHETEYSEDVHGTECVEERCMTVVEN